MRAAVFVQMCLAEMMRVANPAPQRVASGKGTTGERFLIFWPGWSKKEEPYQPHCGEWPDPRPFRLQSCWWWVFTCRHKANLGLVAGWCSLNIIPTFVINLLIVILIETSTQRWSTRILRSDDCTHAHLWGGCGVCVKCVAVSIVGPFFLNQFHSMLSCFGDDSSETFSSTSRGWDLYCMYVLSLCGVYPAEANQRPNWICPCSLDSSKLQCLLVEQPWHRIKIFVFRRNRTDCLGGGVSVSCVSLSCEAKSSAVSDVILGKQLLIGCCGTQYSRWYMCEYE